MTEFAIFLIQNARIPIAILLLFVFLFLLLTLIKPVNSNLISKFNKYFSFKILRVPRPLFLLSLAVFFIWGIWLRIENLGSLEFYGDEFRHVFTAEGFNKTGKFLYWNQTANKPINYIYNRASFYTWQVAQSFKFFGVNETTARIPSVLWGILFLIVILFIAYEIKSTNLLTLVFFSQIVFDTTLIWQTRTVRMYTIFYTLFFLMIFLILRLIRRKTSFNNRVGLGSLVVMILFITYKTHQLAVLLIPAVILFSLYRIQYLKITFLKKKNLLLTLLISAIIFGIFGLRFFGNHIEFSQPNIEYFFLSIKFFAQPLFALILIAVGIVYVLTQRESVQKNQNIFLLVLLISYLGLMIFATNRYNNLRYLFPTVVIVYWFFAQGVIFTIHKTVKILKLGSNVALLIAAVIVLLFGVKISIPNLTKNTLFTSVAVANSFPDPGLGYTKKYREIYDYIRTYNPEAKIFALHGPHQLWYANGLVISTVPDIVPNLPPSSKKYFTDENTAISKVQQELDENPEFIVNFENYSKNNNVLWLIVYKKIEPTWFSKMIGKDYQFVELKISKNFNGDENILVFKKIIFEQNKK